MTGHEKKKKKFRNPKQQWGTREKNELLVGGTGKTKIKREKCESPAFFRAWKKKPINVTTRRRRWDMTLCKAE